MSQTKEGLILIVAKDAATRDQFKLMLDPFYETEMAGSGVDALQVLPSLKPDLILLDTDLSGLSGVDTCRRIRTDSLVPVIFVNHQNGLEDQLEAFEAGGNDLITQPVSQELLLKKVDLAIQTHQNAARLRKERDSMESMALNFLTSVGETGALLDFFRSSIQCRSYYELAARLSEVTRTLGMQCYGVIRSGATEQYFRTDGEPTRLEKDVLAKVAGMGRLFQFKTQLVVNYGHISIIATNVPEDDPQKMGQFRNNLDVLAGTTESLIENVEMRQESMARAEQLQVALMGAVAAVENIQEQHRLLLADTRILLQDLIDNAERTFSWLGTTVEQERSLNEMMNQSVQRILDQLTTRGQFEVEFASVLSALRGPTSSSDIDLF